MTDEKTPDPLNEHLMENMADDPYGTATYVIAATLRMAASYYVHMNETEAKNLFLMSYALSNIDPQANVPTALDFGLDFDPGEIS